MLDEQDIRKLAQVFATKAELQAAVSNLATKDDINELLNSIDAYANKADTYFQEMVMLRTKWIGMKDGYCSLPRSSG